MKTHNVTIIASGVHPASEDFADRFYEAGCDDATIAFQKGLIVLEFDREARTFTSALVTAMRDVVGAGATIERIEPDYLVSASEIAKRSDLGRAAVSLYAKGERSKDFPRPVARVTTDSPLYDWVEVSSWLHHQGRLSLSAVVQAQVVREANRFVVSRHRGEGHLVRKLHAREKLLAAS